jgi:uncharacterized protein (TIGR02099 family)
LRGLLVWGGRLLLLLYFAAALLILVGRHYLMPEIASQRGFIEQKLSTAIGLPVKIAALSASWPGLHPRLAIDGLQLHDEQGRPALAFEHVEAEVGWSSLWHFGLRLHRLEILAPTLDIRRDAGGVIYVAGLPMQGGGDGAFADWLLEQGRVVVRDARLVWHDELRAAPALELQHLNLELRNAGRHHSFGLSATPPTQVASQLDLRGNLIGRNPSDPSSWRGELYADLEQADLAAWAPWLDLPLEWTRGRGGLRLWTAFDQMAVTEFTADLRLADVAVRLQPSLPELALNYLEGRLTGRRSDDGYVGEIRRLMLTTHDGIEVLPTDARLTLDTGKGSEGGEFHANGLDLGALAALAGHLPLPAQVHERLRSFAPRGRLMDIALSWRGTAEAPVRWRVKGRFDELALAAHHELPGFAGISGTLDGNEKSGEIRIDSQQVRLELPAVFPEPTLLLESLEADAGWRARTEGIELQLARVAFKNADANGEASGTYRYTGQGPGEIDLSAKLTQAAGNAVWRYMPLVVNKDARDWLRAAIVGGRSDSTALRLKGPLAQFPFRDGKGGIFQVKGTFQGATLNYAEGWPAITDIDGELLFEGVRMSIRGQRADIMGVALADVHAELPDLEKGEEILTVTGHAAGETQRFLDFIEASPVGTRIDHFTQPMTSAGNGQLDLKLVLPLRRIADTQVDGSFRFADNQLRVLPELPVLAAAQGEFSFTADRLQAKNLRARLLGSPVTADVTSSAGGVVRIDAAGKLPALALRREYGLRALEHLSGEAAWRGTVTVKKPGADIRIESSLEGLSSSLPEPFNKSVRMTLPFKLAGHIEPQRDAWTATLGDVALMRLQQSDEGWRGRAAVGEVALKPAAPLPARGVMLSIVQPSLDVDVWRELLAAPQNGNGQPAAGLPLAGIDIKAAEVRAIERSFHDVQLNGTQQNGFWKIALDSREAQGQLTWDGAGTGRIAGRLSRLTLAGSDPSASAAESMPTDSPADLPAVDLVIENFRLRNMALGELRLVAENRAGAWQAKLDIRNDAAQLTGEGRWRHSASAAETALNFRLDVADAEKLLGRLGLPDAVRRGAGRIDGDLSWAAAPFAFDLSSLSGRLKADIEKGQFKKLEPGVGRLLGVLSLQSLPRRITLDFRDVFSEGFAFDSIVGEVKLDQGMMSTDELNIRGPAAKVLLSGRANLVMETQDLKVRVQPALGESIAVGAMIASPVVGAAVWLAQKALNDPLDQAFAYEYAVTGGWNDPKVEKIGRNPSLPQPSAP